ncbi:MAG: ribonuclease P protein component [Ruaniaceae bacterium]|nr:ribonuclease P protein component [Ruaniaceae bacterium]
MRESEDFSTTIRRGVRAGSPRLVVYVDLTKDSSLVGFVVSRAVGNSVVRHRVARRLRHIVRELVGSREVGYLVVRALPAAAQASNDELRRDLVTALARAERKRVEV